LNFFLNSFFSSFLFAENQANTKPWDNAALSATEKLALLRKNRAAASGAAHVVPSTPTPLLDSRVRMTAETPGGTALVFGTPARFHAGSPVGRKSVLQERKVAAAPVAVPAPVAVAPQAHPNPPRPFADVEPVAPAPAPVAESSSDDFQQQQIQLRQALVTPPLSPVYDGQMMSPIATDVSKALGIEAPEHNDADGNFDFHANDDDNDEINGDFDDDNNNSNYNGNGNGNINVGNNNADSAVDDSANVTADLRQQVPATPVISKGTPQVSDAGSVVNTPYVEDRLQAALARAQAANLETPRADATPIGKKFAGKHESEKLEMLSQLEAELALTRQRHADLVAAVGSNNTKMIDAKQLDAERKAMQSEIDQRQRQLLKLKQIVCDKDDEIGAVNARLRTCEAELVALRDATASLSDRLDDAKRQIGDKDSELQLLRAEKQAMQARIGELLEQAKHNLAVRRRLNNEIQELKGNIRVYCRVRPMSKDEPAPTDQSHRITYPTDEKICITTTEKSNIGGTDKAKEWPFTFNRTFDPKANQQAIFDEISGLVQSALDGFNVCVFAYGQTGAGKTYTMEGPNALDMDDWTKGVIPRAVEQIFTYAAQQAQLGWSYEIHTSFLEIYLDECYDLLATASGTERSADREKLPLMQQRDGTVEIAGLTVTPVTTPDEVYALLKRAALHRATAATRKNDRSSRSHSLFQMKLVGQNLETQAATEGCLNLVDLAGSERVAQSGATGDQLKEAQSINKSLSVLGDVIRSIGEGSAHVPYRNSKLTRLLEPYLGGNSKTLMFVNISPNSKDISESLSSLRFADTVASVTRAAPAKKNTTA
jgi:kinesin family protein C1